MRRSGAFLEQNAMNIVDPPGEYYGEDYYAVYFTDPDSMKLEAMIWTPPTKRRVKICAATRARKPAATRSRRHAQ
jgi:hypothetical protein